MDGSGERFMFLRRLEINPSPIKISVVMTVLNEGGNICGVIESLMRQTRPPDEIVVCDGGSTDGTVDELKSMTGGGIPLKVVVSRGACRGAGRNRAIEAASNPYVAITDGGTRADSGWLALLAAPCIADRGVRIVYGGLSPVMTDRFSRCLAALTMGLAAASADGIRTVTSLLTTRELWADVGGFPEGLTTAEDLIFLERLVGSGAAWAKAPDAVVYWQLPSSLLSSYRRLAAYSRGGLTAGFAGAWHYGTLRNMAVYAVIAALAALINPAVFLAALLFHLVRVRRCLMRVPWFKHEGMFGAAADYSYLAAIVCSMDAATLAGLFKWIVFDGCRKIPITKVSGAAVEEAGREKV